MKVAPSTAPPLPLANPAAGAASDRTVSFEELLEEGVTLQAEQHQRALGFSERGLLVSWSANANGGVDADPSVQAQTMKQVQEAALERFIDHAAPATPMFGNLQAEAPQLNEKLALARRGTGGPPFAKLVGAPVATVIQSRPPVASEEAKVSPVRRTALSRQATPTEPRRLSLVISEQNGAVQIIAGAPELSSEARARLRKAAAALTAEFGVTLSDFTINGAVDDPTFCSIGAPHGDHTG